MAISELEWMRTFGDNLRDIMAENGYSQSELADEIGVTQPTISKYLRGELMPSAKALNNLAHVLDVDIFDILYFGDLIV